MQTLPALLFWGQIRARWRGDANTTLPYQDQVALGIGGNARQRTAVGTIEQLEATALIVAGEHGAAVADHHDAPVAQQIAVGQPGLQHIAITVRSEEHTSELQSLMRISSAVFCLKKK